MPKLPYRTQKVEKPIFGTVWGWADKRKFCPSAPRKMDFLTPHRVTDEE